MNEQVEPLPEDDTKAREGDAAHWAVAELLSGREIEVGQTAPNGITLDVEMCEGADIMDDAVGNERSSLFVESRVDCSVIHPDNWGTPDAWRLFDGWLDVWDYKYGHRHVGEYENWQLLDYAAGIVDMLKAQPGVLKGIRLHIVQPRDYHSSGPIRTWAVSFDELRGYIGRLREAASLTDYLEAQCIANADCRDCKARHACPALQDAAMIEYDVAFDAIPQVLSNGALSRQLQQLDRGIEIMKARRDGLAVQLTDQLTRGEQIPGWMLQRGVGREKWNIPVDEVIAMGTMMGVDVSKPGVITPKQAIKKGLSEEIVSGFTETPMGEIGLVRDDGNKARSVFNIKE